ncbi:hypothetical protein [Mycobacterium lepromatosis]|uniref:hypothetical protein n=1 Tax=Mycobacterium lepromatosis TaxID=480418 RepID=UPI000A4397B0|nr:hypothetical protein [Mycobacterium lepromatosis]
MNAFDPELLKSAALATNAADGNLEVPVIQLVSLLVFATAGHQLLSVAGSTWFS